MHESQNKNTFVQWESYCSVTELKSAGIHFKPSQTGNFTDVEFKSHLIYGPYHHGNPELESLEKLKIIYAQQFVRACSDHISVKQLYEQVAKVADSVRECYKEGFIGMMLLDGCFVIQFICILTNTESNSSDNTETEPKEGDLILET
ncbi:unnamed protein product [Fraxinus pennsylvanica]|uniref:Uncharacterized protein n=1 Tax=Fraxinus pennsylvanica TaxID=56036 RepID=A0AAD2A6M8_9LAMI|nr:unnamed protein product [Fraxinus pennsylvanica]